MGPRTTGLLALLLLAGPAAVRAQEARAPGSAGWTGEQRAIAELIRRTEAANNAGDVEAWVALFAPDAVYMPPGSPPITTRAELVEVARAGFRHRADIAIEPVEIVVAGEWAWARSRVTGTVVVDRTGERVTVDMKQIAIYHRAGTGPWRIARLIGNSSS